MYIQEIYIIAKNDINRNVFNFLYKKINSGSLQNIEISL
jgi:hypothetical protein